MADFIMEFLDWFSDLWNSVTEMACEVAKIMMVVVVVVVTIPLWLIPFAFWLVFVKLRGANNDPDS